MMGWLQVVSPCVTSDITTSSGEGLNMVKIRLERLGRKKRPFYRLVVMDVRKRRESSPIAFLGYYNPLSKELKLNKALAQEWIGKGAIPTDSAKRLIEMAPESGELVTLKSAS
jgi:small subunit ribosomal protein S16